MSITYYSFISSIIFSNILLLFMCLSRKKYRINEQMDVYVFVLLYGISFIRLLLPLDISASKWISVEGIFSYLFDKLVYAEYTICNFKVSIINIAIFLWIDVAVIKNIYFASSYRKMKRRILEGAIHKAAISEKIVIKLKNVYGKVSNCHIRTSRMVNVPVTLGILEPYIILPDIKYTDEELFYIFIHEYTHIRKQDMLKKILVEMVCNIFWWIPVIGFVRKDMEQLIEIRCDSSVIKTIGQDEKIQYMDTLLKSVKRSMKKEDMVGCLSFALKDNKNSMVERFLLLAKETKRIRTSNVFAILMGISLFVISYAIIPVPYYEPNIKEIETDGATAITMENSYMVKEKDAYYLIVDGKKTKEITKEHVDILLQSGIELKKEGD